MNQLANGNVHSLIRNIELPGLNVYDCRWGTACQVTGQFPSDSVMLKAIVTNDGAGVRWCGSRLTHGVFAIASSEKQIEFSVDQWAHTVGILIRPGLLQQTCGSEVVDFIHTHQNVCFDTQSGSALVKLVLDLVQFFETQPLMLKQSVIYTMTRLQLLQALKESFAGMLQEDESTPSIREKAFDAAIPHVKQARQHTSARQLSEATGVSQKTLEVAFKECIGITPGRYLLLTRLNDAHRQLVDSRAVESSVTQIARDCGFTHPGRFSCAYRQLFGELPSQTMGRSRRLD
ncbi:MAG: helix-turn-helix domain-containing protein [Halioglobus sp.]